MLGAVGLAMSDIYGGNAVQLTFFLLADLLAGTAVLPQASSESLWLGGLGALVTAIMIYGLLMRPKRKLTGLGPRLADRAPDLHRRSAAPDAGPG
jgi:cation:H+ antiporter